MFQEQCSFKNIELRQEVKKTVPRTIYADPKRIKQILMNMISNALKFTSKGFISVTISMVEEDAVEKEAEAGKDANVLERAPFDSSFLKLQKQIDPTFSKTLAPPSTTLGENPTIKKPETEEEANANAAPNRLERKIKIEIEDTGMGIKQNNLNKLFKYFGKLRDKKKMN